MTSEPFQNVQIPRVGSELNSQPGAASDACQAPSEAYLSVMGLLAKLIGFFLMTAFGVTLVMVVGYTFAGWAGDFVLVAVIGMVLSIVFRSG